MVRTKKYNNAEYILIDTDIMVYEEGQIATIVPVQVQVRLKDIPEKQQKAIYKYTSLYFDRTFAVNKPQPEVKKGWFSNFFYR